MPSAIDPGAIPGKDIDPDAIESHGRAIGAVAVSVRDNGSDVHLKWQGMSGVYSAPESGTLLGLMQPVSTQATAVGDNLDVVSSALVRFAGDVRPIKAELDALRLQAQSFVDTAVAHGVSVRELDPAWVSTYGYYGSGAAAYPASAGAASPAAEIPQYRYVTREWHEDQASVDRNNELIAAVNAQQVLLWDAERACANRIRALYGAAPLHAYRSEDDTNGYGLEEIPEGTEMPWGAPVDRTEGCGEASFTFVVKDLLWEGVVVGGVWGTIEGLGTLTLGWNPATGEWFSGDAYGAAWGSLGLLAAGVVIAATPPLNLINAIDDTVQQFGGESFLPEPIADFDDRVDETLLNTGKALVAWDQWQDDPGTALGETIFNVGTILIPAGAAVAGVKTAGTAASVLSKMARVVDLVDPGAWVANGALKVGATGLGSLDNLIGGLDAAAKLDPPNFAVHTAPDSATALSMLDDLGVDLDSVTAKLDAGGPALEFPGGRIDLDPGAFDGVTDGATDAGHAATSPPPPVPAHTNLDAPPPHAGADAPQLPYAELTRLNDEYRLANGAVDPARLVEWSEKVSEAYPALTPEQVRGIYDYTTDPGYQAMNPYLRNAPGATPVDVRALEQRITDATEGLANLPAAPSLGEPYKRGVTLDDTFLAQFQPGERWSDPSFVSSSRELTVADDFKDKAAEQHKYPGLITIDALTPADITPLSRFRHEEELLFQRGTPFEVVSKFLDEDGIWRIHLREVWE